MRLLLSLLILLSSSLFVSSSSDSFGGSLGQGPWHDNNNGNYDVSYDMSVNIDSGGNSGPGGLPGLPLVQYSFNSTCYQCLGEPLTLDCGKTYRFHMGNVIGFPWYLSRTNDESAFNNMYTDGILDSGLNIPCDTNGGDVLWEIQDDAPSSLYYCALLQPNLGQKNTCGRCNINPCHRSSSSSSSSTGGHSSSSSSSGMRGDPHLTGLQKQEFEVHGLVDTWFSLIKWISREFNLDSYFIYLASGINQQKDLLNHHTKTTPWSHPGTYLGKMKFNLPSKHSLEIDCGSYDLGFTSVVYDGKVLLPSDSPIIENVKIAPYNSEYISYEDNLSIHYRRFDEFIVKTSQLSVRIINSDLFCNLDVSLLDKEMLTIGASNNEDAMMSLKYSDLHGLIGQTWKNLTYQHPYSNAQNMPYEGDITDYQVHFNNKPISKPISKPIHRIYIN